MASFKETTTVGDGVPLGLLSPSPRWAHNWFPRRLRILRPLLWSYVGALTMDKLINHCAILDTIKKVEGAHLIGKYVDHHTLDNGPPSQFT